MNSSKLNCDIVRNQGGYLKTRIENLYKDNKIRSNKKKKKNDIAQSKKAYISMV